MKRKLGIVAGVIAGLVVVALVVVYFSINGIVRSKVETSATQSLKLPTKLGGASVALFGGDVTLSDLEIQSPEGFTAPQMFTLGEVSVETSYSELLGEPVKVATISITQPKLVLEQAGGRLNVKELYDNLQSDKPAPTDEKTEPLKLVINSLKVNGAVVEIRPGIPGMDQPISLKLPDIAMTNIGNADGTQTGEEVGRVINQIVQELANKALESDQVPKEIRDILKLNPDEIRRQVETRVNKEIEKGKEKLQGEAEKALGDLLNKKEKDKK